MACLQTVGHVCWVLWRLVLRRLVDRRTFRLRGPLLLSVTDVGIATDGGPPEPQTGGQDDLVTVYSPLEQRVVARCQGHCSFVTGIAFDPWQSDDRTSRFASVSEDCKVIFVRSPLGLCSCVGRNLCGRGLATSGTSLPRRCRDLERRRRTSAGNRSVRRCPSPSAGAGRWSPRPTSHR